MAQRVQLQRTKGYRKPETAIVVARPSKWGNPFPIDDDWMVWTAVGCGWMGNREGRRACAVALYRSWLTGEPVRPGPLVENDGGYIEFSDGSSSSVAAHVMGIARYGASLVDAPSVPVERPSLDELRDELRGKDLACWCPLDEPCHADVLLELANGGA